jgi:tetratricopeptide (TPR) repeat protein
MKKQIIALILAGITTAYSQLTNAVLAVQSNELKIAKESIDKYMAKEKSLTDPKGWYYKGLIYEFTAKNDSARPVEAKATLNIAIEAYRKTIELDKPKGEWVSQAGPRLDLVYNTAFNKAIENYRANKITDALEAISFAQSIKPTDSLAYSVGAAIAYEGKDFEYARKAYSKMIELKYNSKTIYKNLYLVVKQQLKNNEEALKVITDARKLYPNDMEFQSQEIDLYITLGKQQEAVEKLTEAIKSDPVNAKLYYYNLGILYKQSNDNVKSKESLLQSLAIDSLYEGSNYMVGLIYLEEGDVINRKVNNMTLKDYNVSGKKEEAKRDMLYKKAIPYFEKSYKVEKNDKVKDQLTTLYTKFKMTEKLKSLQ